MSALADRIGKLEERQDRLEARVDRIEARLDKIEERLDAFTNDMRAFQTQVMGMFQQLNATLQARLPPVVGQAPMLVNLVPNHGPRQQIEVWQWNCRGFRRKRGNLQLHIQNLDSKPDIIALQEASGWVKLPGFKAFTPPEIDRGVYRASSRPC